jgi:dihydroxyacetone kinase
MLDAAVSGPIFASPNAQHIRTGLRHIASPKGTLVIVKNYTGDRLNFGLATELSRAYDGRDIETVTVQDDVSVPRSCCGVVGRRGLAGVVLVHKIAGASAAEGKSLPQVAAIARAVADRIATIGVSVEGCSIPGAPRSRQVDCDVLELGMGIHNEPGTRKLETDISTAELISTLLSTLLDENNPERGFLKRDEDSETVLLINNLGGLSKLELLSLTDYVLLALKSEYGISPCRVFSGTYLSSLDGSGFSITLFSLPNGVQGMDLLRLLDAPTKSVNWQHASPNPSTQRINSPLADNAGNDVTSVLASAQAAISCKPITFERACS